MRRSNNEKNIALLVALMLMLCCAGARHQL